MRKLQLIFVFGLGGAACICAAEWNMINPVFEPPVEGARHLNRDTFF